MCQSWILSLKYDLDVFLNLIYKYSKSIHYEKIRNNYVAFFGIGFSQYI